MAREISDGWQVRTFPTWGKNRSSVCFPKIVSASSNSRWGRSETRTAGKLLPVVQKAHPNEVCNLRGPWPRSSRKLKVTPARAGRRLWLSGRRTLLNKDVTTFQYGCHY